MRRLTELGVCYLCLALLVSFMGWLMMVHPLWFIGWAVAASLVLAFINGCKDK